VYRAYNVTDTWNGWLTQYNAGLVLSQQFAAVQLVLYFSTFSSPTAVACLHFTLHYLNCLMLPQLPHFSGICTALSIGRQSIVMSMSVCVCVFVCPLSNLWNYMSDLHRIFVPVIYGRGLVLLWRRSDTLHAALGLAVNCAHCTVIPDVLICWLLILQVTVSGLRINTCS